MHVRTLPLLPYTKDSLITTVLPSIVLNCLAFPLLSRTLPVPAVGTLGILSTWLAKNSSDVARSTYVVFDSRSFPVSKHSVVGTRSICPKSISRVRELRAVLTWLLTGLHCCGKGLLKNARKKGLKECIHTTWIQYHWQSGCVYPIGQSGNLSARLKERRCQQCPDELWLGAERPKAETHGLSRCLGMSDSCMSYRQWKGAVVACVEKLYGTEDACCGELQAGASVNVNPMSAATSAKVGPDCHSPNCSITTTQVEFELGFTVQILIIRPPSTTL